MTAFAKRLANPDDHQAPPPSPRPYMPVARIGFRNCYTVGAEGVNPGIRVADNGCVVVGWAEHGGIENYAEVYRRDPPFFGTDERGRTVACVASFDCIVDTDQLVIGRRLEGDDGVYVAIYTIHPRVTSFKGRAPDMNITPVAGNPQSVLYGTNPVHNGTCAAIEQIWRLMPEDVLHIRFWDGVERKLTLASGVPVLSDVVSAPSVVPAEKSAGTKPKKKKAKLKKGKKAEVLSEGGSKGSKKQVLSDFSQLAGALGTKETVH